MRKLAASAVFRPNRVRKLRKLNSPPPTQQSRARTPANQLLSSKYGAKQEAKTATQLYDRSLPRSPQTSKD